MQKQYTLRTVPYSLMRPMALSFQALCGIVITQLYTPEWEHQGLAARLVWLKEKTGDFRGVPRGKAIATCTAWYDLAKDLAAVCDPLLAKPLQDAIVTASWIEPAWEYMKGQTAKSE